MKLPEITVVTPSYNQGNFLEETILSVLAQNYPKIEYVIMDGGSDDSSVEIIKRYSHRLAYWESEKDRGQSHAINKGLRMATGEIMGWLCSDDTYLQGALMKVGAFMAQNPGIDVIYGDVAAIDGEGNVMTATRSLNFNRLGLLSRSGSIPQPASFFRKEVLDRIGYLDESIEYCMDYEFFLRAAFAECRFQRIPETIATYRYHPLSKTVRGKSIHNKHDEAMERHQKKFVNNYKMTPLKLLRILFNLKRIIFNLDRYWKYRENYFKQLRSKTKGLIYE
jgi:glycosyltransferase involved in cell wall biosynthesis